MSLIKLGLRIGVILICLSIGIQLSAQDSTKSKLEFRFTPYFWFLGIKGTIERPPTPSNYPYLEPRLEFDLTFDEVRHKLKYALLFTTEINKNRIVTGLDYTGLILEGVGSTPYTTLLPELGYRLNFQFVEAYGGYSFIKKKKVRLSALGGARTIFTSVRFEANYALDQIHTIYTENFTVNPFVGFRLDYNPIEPLEMRLYSDLGQFYLNDDISFQVVASVNYTIFKHLFVSVMYRHLQFRSTIEEATFNGRFTGPAIRLGFSL